MNPPKTGLITFGDARDHEWAKLFQGLTEPRHQQAIKYFEQLPVDLVCFDSVARKINEIDEQADQLKVSGVESLVAHVPCWVSPNMVLRGIQRINLPTILLSNKDPGTHGSVGLFGAAGALDQIGFSHLRVREEFEGSDSQAVARKALPFIRAASAVARLKGRNFGLFGGRSLGIDTGTFDPMQWRRQFGVDAEHIDQLEIIRLAEEISEEDTRKTMDWLSEHMGSIGYDDKGLIPDKLAYQVRCYLATKKIISERHLDFVAIKCMPDLTNHYVPQCLSAALLPGPYDADGVKETTVMACEADADAGLTSEIMKLVSNGLPTMFADVSYINDQTHTFYLPNCGGMCTWFAARSNDASENLKKVHIRPAIRPGGGGTTYLTCAPGPLTLGRLYRKSGEYSMAIFSGEAIELPKDEYEAFVATRGSHQLPTAFVKTDVDIDRFVDEFASNHICAVPGNWVTDLEHVCRLLDIRAVVLDR
ncbi:MAG: L-fucose isomerase [Nitrospirota bacterium]|nr:L-fucose isomerase [Nitrospirota bacterium]